jgi:hypothetical protein
VLIESMNPKQFTQSPNDTQPQTASQSRAFSPLSVLARFGVVRLMARPLGLVPDLPTDVQPAYLSRLARPSALQAVTDDAQGMPESGTQAAAVKSLGDLPLIVLTGRLNRQAGWQAWQTELLELSSNSQQLFAEKSGHIIELDQPEAAVDAIVKMVERVRQQ